MVAAATKPLFPIKSAPGLPGDGGRYQLRDTYAQLRDMHGFLQHRRARFGPNFTFGSFGFVIFAVGEPELVRAIHLDHGDAFSSRIGWHFSIGELFEGGLMLRDFEEHREHRAMVQAAFRPSAMAGYFDIIERCIVRELDTWSHGQPTARAERLNFFPAIKTLGLKVALELILGISSDDREAERIGQAFKAAVLASVAPIRRPIPPLQYWRGMRGRRYLQAWFAEEIKRRRDVRSTDIFSRLCATELSDEQIVNHLIFLVMAAHDTTASALTTTMWAACRYPEWQQRMRQEVVEHEGPLAADGLDHLVVNDWVFKEALRFQPPGPFMMRRTVREVELGPYTLPANLSVAPISLITHFLPQWWTDPDRFDPERFSPGRAEHKGHPALYYPFGVERITAWACIWRACRRKYSFITFGAGSKCDPLEVARPAFEASRFRIRWMGSRFGSTVRMSRARGASLEFSDSIFSRRRRRRSWARFCTRVCLGRGPIPKVVAPAGQPKGQ